MTGPTSNVMVDGQLVSRDLVQPDRKFREAWSLEDNVIVVDIVKAKPIAHEKVSEWRTAQKAQPFTVAGIGEFSSDAESKQNIDGASQAALMAVVGGAPFSIDWSLHDDTVVTLDGTEMMAVGQALMAHINAAHIASRVINTAIEAATTIEEIETQLALLI